MYGNCVITPYLLDKFLVCVNILCNKALSDSDSIDGALRLEMCCGYNLLDKQNKNVQ